MDGLIRSATNSVEHRQDMHSRGRDPGTFCGHSHFCRRMRRRPALVLRRRSGKIPTFPRGRHIPFSVAAFLVAQFFDQTYPNRTGLQLAALFEPMRIVFTYVMQQSDPLSQEHRVRMPFCKWTLPGSWYTYMYMHTLLRISVRIAVAPLRPRSYGTALGHGPPMREAYGP